MWAEKNADLFCGWVLAFIVVKAFKGTVGVSFNIGDFDIGR